MPERLGEAWCSLHDCHPKDCFYVHNPKAKELEGKKIESPKKLRKRIKRTHLALQVLGRNGSVHNQ